MRKILFASFFLRKFLVPGAGKSASRTKEVVCFFRVQASKSLFAAPLRQNTMDDLVASPTYKGADAATPPAKEPQSNAAEEEPTLSAPAPAPQTALVGAVPPAAAAAADEKSEGITVGVSTLLQSSGSFGSPWWCARPSVPFDLSFFPPSLRSLPIRRPPLLTCFTRKCYAAFLASFRCAFDH